MGSWIIVHGEDGEVIDYKPYADGAILIFEALENEQPNKFTVTDFFVNEFLGVVWHRLESYTEVTEGAILDFSCSSEEPVSNTVIGEFSLTVNNVPNGVSLKEFVASNGQNGGYAYSTGTPNGATFTFTSSLKIFEAQTDYLISVRDGDGGFKYYVLDNYVNGGSYIIDYSLFSAFDNLIAVDYPLHAKLRLSLTGYDESENSYYYLSNLTSSGDFGGSFQLGTYENFDQYRILYNISPYTNYEYEYSDFGALPSTLIIPDQPSFTITNESVFEFEFSTNLEDYLEKTSEWVFQDGNYTTSWRIGSVKDYSPKLGGFPPNLIEMYPNLNLQALEHNNIEFRLNEKERITIYSAD